MAYSFSANEKVNVSNVVGNFYSKTKLDEIFTITEDNLVEDLRKYFRCRFRV